MDKKEIIKTTIRKSSFIGGAIVVAPILLAIFFFIIAESQLTIGLNTHIWNIVLLFALSLVVFSILIAGYLLIYWGLESDPKNLIHSQLKIAFRSTGYGPRAAIFFPSLKKHYVTPEGWILGLQVSKDIYDAIKPGDVVDITYYRFSWVIKDIKII